MANENVKNFFEQAGSGQDNVLVIGAGIETETGTSLKTRSFTLSIGDVSIADSAFVSPGVAGSIVKITNVIDAAITVADAGLTFEIGGVAVTGAAITIANAGSAAGDVDQSTPTALNVITATDAIEVVKDGLSSTSSSGVVTFEILLS